MASEGDSLEREDLPHYYSDDHLWIILAVCAYLKETGDLAFLDEAIPYYEKDKQTFRSNRAACSITCGAASSLRAAT